MSAGLNLHVLQGAGCTLDADGHARQRERVFGLRSHVERVDDRDGVVSISFDAGVDRTLVDEFVAVEGECCGFLALGYDAGNRVLRVSSGDDEKVDIVKGFAAVFERSAS